VAGYGIIAAVSEALVSLLSDRIREREDVGNVDPDSVALISPDEVGEESDVRLGVYLYNVTENPTMKNADRARTEGTRYRDPPLALDLEYLVTAYPGSSDGEETARNVTQQRLLGLAMQIFHDNAHIDADALAGVSDEDADPQIAVDAEPIDVLTGLWSSLDGASFAPSITYHVGPVFIDSQREESIPDVHEPETRTNQKPDPRRRDR
jgi:hypothetical protein